MNTRTIAALLILGLAPVLLAACNSDDPPTAPTGNCCGTPTVTAITPPGAAAGLKAKVIGTNFGTGKRAGSVKVTGIEAVIETWSDTEIEFIVPPGVQSDVLGNLVVTNAAGKSATSEFDIPPANTFRVTTDFASDRYPCFGPGANYIYFSSTRSGGANWDLYRIPITGGEAQRLTNFDEPDFYPDVKFSSGEIAWSSSADHLGYNTDGDTEIFSGYLVGVQGGQVTMGLVTQNVSRDLDPAWANTVHAGYNMASTWEQVEENGSFVAWRVVLHGQGLPEDLTEGRQPNFSSNGQWVVYNHQQNIYKIQTVSGSPMQITDTGMDSYPHWGWANDKIVFQRYASGSDDIYVMNADGTDVQELVSTSNGEYTPSWSFDCSKVVYCGHRWGNFDIYVYVVP